MEQLNQLPEGDTPESIEQEALDQGWVPKENFKGDESRWVSADIYVERGRQIMPILKNNNKRLVSDINQLKTTVGNLTQALNESRESMEALKQFHEQSTKAQVEKARKDILSSLKDAKTEGDVDQEIRITSELSQFDAAQKESQQVKDKKQQAPVKQDIVPIQPFLMQWMSENPWYGVDIEKSALMDGVAKRMRSEQSTLYDREFLDAALQVVEQRLSGGTSQQRSTKVEGTKHSSTVSSTGRGYSGLPAEAREICERQSSSFVGPNKAYKTVKEWQDVYTREYNKINERN